MRHLAVFVARKFVLGKVVLTDFTARVNHRATASAQSNVCDSAFWVLKKGDVVFALLSRRHFCARFHLLRGCLLYTSDAADE